jgi:hypothetical protein
VIYKEDCCVVGTFGFFFQQRSEFLFKTFTNTQGFGMRREKWQLIIKDRRELFGQMKY